MRLDRKPSSSAKSSGASQAESPAADKGVLRDSGSALLGALPWGTHVCQFYETRADLLDILVPYFSAGLKNNEFCLWITAAPLTPEAAEHSLSKAVPGLAEYKRRGQIEIIPYTKWYAREGRFNVDAVLRQSVQKEEWALANGYAGLRASGNAPLPDGSDLRALLGYEQAIDSVIGARRALAVCSYPLGKCALPDLIEVLDTHEFAIIKSQGGWHKVAGGRRRSAAALSESEAKYRVFFEQSHDSILLLEMPPGGEPVIREINPVALKAFGYSREEIIGKPVSILNADPGASRAITARNRGKSGVNFVVRHKRKDGSVFTAEATGREIMVGGKLMAISVERDITERMKAEEELKRTCADLGTEKRLLEEKNIAFREALGAIEAEKNKMKDEIIVNVHKIVLPILKRMRLEGGAPRVHLDLLEKSLQTLISSFGRKLTEKNLRLTPKEIEISNMVRAGLTTKEIAGLLNASAQTVDKHRNNIRRKLGLANKDVNLVSFLQNL